MLHTIIMGLTLWGVFYLPVLLSLNWIVSGIAPAQIALFGGLTTPLFFLVLFLWNRRLRSSLGHIRKELQQFTKNDTIDLSRPIDGSDNRASLTLIREINTMTNSLNTIFLDITRSTRKFNLFASDIFFSAKHLSDESSAQAHSMESIMAKVEGFQKNLELLKNNIATVLDELTQTSQLFQDLERTSQHASQRLEPLTAITRNARSEGEAGQKKISQSSQSVTMLMNGLHQFQESMESMGQRTNRIGQVIHSLEDISERTHILATNASIEAARAGQEGKGFGVIASEIRTLASNSRSAIQDVGLFLKEMSQDINLNSQLWTQSLQQIEEVQGFTTETQDFLTEIGENFSTINGEMELFHQLFQEQRKTIFSTLSRSEHIHQGIDAFSRELDGQSQGYGDIHQEIAAASRNSRTASQSASVLSQLGTYLRIGGQELKYVVTKFKVSEQRHLGSISRKEPRKVLLYNLEVFRGELLLGHLGDLSPSGLLLYSENSLEIGKAQEGIIRLPLGFGDSSIPVVFTPRRIEKDSSFFRIGCSLEASNVEQRTAIEQVLDKLTIHDGDENEPPGQSNSTSNADTVTDTNTDIEELEILEEL